MRKVPPCFARSRGAVSRAASALLFVCAAVAVVVFPEGEAEGLSAKVGFRPAQTPVGVLAANSAEYGNPLLCSDLGGKVETGVAGESVCSEIDANDTFCIVGSSDALPCRGLFKHVIVCNDTYTRPALNPFFCGARCDEATEKARGARCERFFPAEEILPESSRRVTVDGRTQWDTGTIATVRVSVLTDPDFADYGFFDLVNHRPATASVSDGLVIVDGADDENFLLQIAASRPLLLEETARTLVAKSFCETKDADNREKCYPTLLTIAVDFTGTVPSTVVLTLREDDVVPSAARNVVLDAVVGYSGRGYAIPVESGHVLSDERFDANLLGYDANDEVILILSDNPVAAEGLTLSLSASGDCAGDEAANRCVAVSVSIVAEFQGVAGTVQDSASVVFPDGFTVSLTLPAGYESSANKPGRVLEIVGVDGLSGDLANVSLFVNADNLEYAPDGAESGALAAGQYKITLEMSQTDSSPLNSLLGTVTLEVDAAVTPRDLDANDFGLSEQSRATITVAAGVGEVVEELVRLSLSESAAGAIVVLPDAFPGNISVGLEGENSVAVFYLTTMAESESEFSGTASLTVTLNSNHNTLEQLVALTVSALRQRPPTLTSGIILANAAYENANIHNFKSGDYANAVFLKTQDPKNSPGLVVSSDGVVSTETGGITAAKAHTIIFKAASPDYVGNARLELVLHLVEQGEFVPEDTIPPAERARLQLVAPGYTGSVAFFAAGRLSVTLQTPSNPTGFNFGADGANSDYAYPDGFTLYLSADAGVDAAGEIAEASFVVVAKDSGGGFGDLNIDVAVTVSALAAPAQTRLETNSTTNFDRALALTGLPGGLDGNDGDLNIVRASKLGGGDSASLFRLEGKNLRPTDAGGVAPGYYDVFISWTHPKFLGALTVKVDVAVAEVIVANSVVAEEDRNKTVTVAAGYSGDGYDISLKAGYVFQTVLYDETAADYDTDRNVILIRDGVMNDLELAVTATADCASSAGRNCVPLALTVTVTFIPLHPVAQDKLEAAEGDDFRLTIKTGAYENTDMNITRSGDLFNLEKEGNGDWSVIPNGASPPQAGTYTIALDMTHSGFRGTLPLAVTASIQETVEPNDVVLAAGRNVELDAAVGYFGRGHAISVEDGYTLTAEKYDSGLLGYDDVNKVVSILAGNKVPESGELALTLSGEGRCADRDCKPAQVSVIAVFRAVAAPAQNGAARDYLEGFTVGLNLPLGYAFGDGKSGRALSLIVSEELSNVSLRLDADNDALEYAPNGELADALPVGAHTVTVALTETAGLLGTVLMQFTANISPRPLNSADFAFSAPHPAATVTIAAGDGAVGLELSRVSLIVSDDSLGAVVRDADAGAFPENLSLAFLPPSGGQTVVFYLSRALSGDGNSVERTAELTIAVANPNYAPLTRNVTLQITALRNPGLEQKGGNAGRGNPFNSDSLPDGYLHNFKTGDYANVTVFERDEAVSSPELTLVVDTGIVSTKGDITLGGNYTLAAYATSPDFVGKARLELRLNLVAEGRFTPTDTIKTTDRTQNIVVVPGYSGSVAFFAAGLEGVTLRTPSLAPAGFHLGGADALDADFKSPEGFTLFLESGQVDSGGSTVVAEFAVTATMAEFASLEIELTVSVAALTPPIQATLTAEDTDAIYGRVSQHSIYSLDNPTITGADFYNAANVAAPLTDWAARVTIAGADLLPVDASAVGGRLAAGKYRITVKTTHSDFLGDLLLSVPVNIQETLNEDNVVTLRVVNQPVADGHFGAEGDAGYQIPLENGYTLSGFSYNAVAVTVAEANSEIKPVNAVSAPASFEAAVTADVVCVDAIGMVDSARNCAPLKITVSVIFTPVAAVKQSILSAAEDAASYDHTIAFPQAAQYGGPTLEVADAGLAGRVTIDVDNKLQPAGVGSDERLSAGRHQIPVRVVYPGVLGALTVVITANIQQTLNVNDIVRAEARNATVTVATGYSGRGYQIPVVVADHVFQTVLFDTETTGYDEDNYILIPPNRAVTENLQLAVTATAICSMASGRDCAPRALTVSVTFVPLQPIAQSDLNAVYDQDFAAHRVSIGAYEDDRVRVALTIVGVEGDGGSNAFKLDGSGNIVRSSDNTLRVGVYTISLGMSHSANAFLGTLALSVRVSVSPLSLPLADFALSAPHPSAPAVTVAAGAGAGGLEIARISLTVSESVVSAFVRESSSFPDNLSLAFLPSGESQTVVFYLTRPLSGNGIRVRRTAELTVDSANPNYGFLAQNVALNITALRKPDLDVVDGQADPDPFNEADFHNFKTGYYANATNFARDDAASSPELIVNADTGLVSANGDIAQTGSYTLVVSVASPDFRGRARLELRLILRGEGDFRTTDTIPLGRRVQEIFAATDYSGSVAFFAAGKEGVTLRTPSVAPAGFSFGAGGLDAEFVSPAGFTLFLDEELGTLFFDGKQLVAGERAVEAVFAVTALAAGFNESEIGVTVSVSAVAAPPQRLVEADYLEGWAANLEFPDGYETGAPGRDTWIFYPLALARTGAIAANQEVCEALGGTRPVNFEGCVGYSESNDHKADYSGNDAAAKAKRGVCTWRKPISGFKSPFLQVRPLLHYSCDAAFANARDCNLMENKAAKNNSECAAVECGVPGEIALGGKCVAVSLNGAGDRLTHEDSGGDAGFAVNAGSRSFVVGMTQAELLGTVRLQVPANIRRTPLDAGRFSLSAPHPAGTVIVAAGTRAVGLELARVSLFESAKGAVVREPSSFPDNLSLAFLPPEEEQTVAIPSPVALDLPEEGRTVVFYLTRALGDGNAAERTAALTVDSSDPNHLPLAQEVALRISVLNPILAVVEPDVQSGVLYESDNLYNFKTGDYKNATAFELDAAASSSELAVNETTGIVSTNGGINQGDVYRLVVSVTSPDFVGRARLELQLVLRAQDDFHTSDTIRFRDRFQDIFVAPGYSGSVAFFAAGLEGLTLQTPLSAPAGFGFGEGGLNANFVSPAGFTLFLNADEIVDEGDAASAEFAVVARFEGKAQSGIGVTVSVWAVSTAVQGDLVADYQDADYDDYYFTPLDGFEFRRASLRIAGVYDAVNGASVADGAERITVTNSRSRLGRPKLGPGADKRLEVGMYEVTVGMTHPDFLGELSITLLANIETTVSHDNIAGERRVVQHVVPGYFGALGRVLTVESDYELRNLDYDADKFTVVADLEKGEYEVRLVAPMPNVNRTAAVTADAVCKNAVNCPALTVTLSVTFTPLIAPVQALLDAGDGGENYDYVINLPAAAGSGLLLASLRIAGAQNTVAPAAPVVDIADRVTVVNGQLQPVGVGVGQQLTVGGYEITVEATRPGAFWGTLTLKIPARIRNSVNPDDVMAAANRDLTVSVAVGHPALADLEYRIPAISIGYKLTSLEYDTRQFTLDVDTDEARLRVDMPNSDVEMTVESDVSCVDSTGSVDTARNCAPLRLTLSVTFRPVAGDRQNALTADHSDTAYNHAIIFPAGYADATAAIVNANLVDRVTIKSGELQPVEGADPNRRLFTGTHRISVRITHPKLVGTLTVVVAADVSGELRPDHVVLNRNPTVYVVHEWFSAGPGSNYGNAGYVIPVVSGYQLTNITVGTGGVLVKYEGDSGEIALANRLDAPNTFTVSLSADARCSDRICVPDPLEISVTLLFAALEDPSQSDVTVSEGDTAYNHTISVPEELGRDGASYEILRVVKVVNGVDAPARLTIDGNGVLKPINGGLTADNPDGTRYVVTPKISYSGRLLGDFQTPFTVHVGKPVDANAVLTVTARNVTLDVVEGHFGGANDAGYQIPFSTERVEVSVSYVSSGSPAFTVSAGASGGHEIGLLGPLSSGQSVRALTLTAVASCAPAPSRICGAPATITLTATFNLINNPVKNIVASPVNAGFTVSLNIPDKYSAFGGDKQIADLASRVFRFVGDYPLPLSGDVPVNRASCVLLGGRYADEDGVQSCAGYAFTNSDARTATGGGCVIAGAAAGRQCSVAFQSVRDCNLRNMPALNNSQCSSSICAGGGVAIGGVCPAFSAFVLDRSPERLTHLFVNEEVALRGGVHTVTMAMTHPQLLGRLVLGAVATVEPIALPDDFGLSGGLSRTVTVAADYTGVVYRDTATDNGTIATPPPADIPSGFSATGGRTVEIELTLGVSGGENTSGLFSLTVNHGNRNRAANYNPKAQDLQLRVEALSNAAPALPLITANIYSGHVYDFAGPGYARGVYAGATFSVIADSPHFTVSDQGVVRVQGSLNPGEYAVTLAAENPPAFVGVARLTLSLTIGADLGAGEYVRYPAPVVRVAAGYTGPIHAVSVMNDYTLTWGSPAGESGLSLDIASGVFSVPDGDAMGESARSVTVVADIVCPGSGEDSQGTPCAAGQKLEITLVAVPVLNPETVTVSPTYNDANFKQAIRLPRISTPTDFESSNLPRYASDQLTIVIARADPEESANKFGLVGSRVSFNLDDPPAAGRHTLHFHISHSGGDGIAGFVGTLDMAAMDIRVRRMTLAGVPKSDRISPSDGALRVLSAFGATAVLLKMTLADVDVAAAFTEPPPSYDGDQYTLFYSDDRRTLFVGRNPNSTLAVVGTNDTAEVIDAMFTVAVTGANAGNYQPKVQRFMMLALQYADPIVVKANSPTFRSADGVELPSFYEGVSPYQPRQLTDLSQIYVSSSPAGYAGATVYGDIPRVSFRKVSGSDELVVDGDGRISVPEAISTGSDSVYTIVAEAFASAVFVGRARFTVTLRVSKQGDLQFAGYNATVVGGTIAITTEIVENERVSVLDSTRQRKTLYKVTMVYHGKRRGLHWIYGEGYHTDPGVFSIGSNGLNSGDEWFSKAICDAGNTGGNSSGWRLPTLIEMAGGVLPDAASGDESDREIVARVNGFSSGLRPFDVFEIVGGGGRVDFVTLTVKAKNTGDTGPLPDSTAAAKGFFAGLFDVGESTNDQKYHPAYVHYDETDNKVWMSQGQKGRVVCVRAAGAEFESTAVWAEVSVDDQNKSVVTLTSSLDTGAANVTIGLGLFTARGQTAPEPVTARFTKDDLDVERLDENEDIFIVNIENIDGGVNLKVAAGNVEKGIRSGTFTLSVSFTPAGKYVGLAQRDFNKSNYISTDERQFDVVRLTVQWAPPPESVTVFRFAGTDISVIGGTATATAADRTYSSSSNSTKVDMEYYGDVGGLRVMFSPAAQGGVSFGPRLCASGGDGWRNPTLSELGMLLTPDGSATMAITLSVSGFPGATVGAAAGLDAGMPGNHTGDNSFVVTVTFPQTEASTGMAAKWFHRYSGNANGNFGGDPAKEEDDVFRVMSGVFDNGGDIQVLVYDYATGRSSLKEEKAVTDTAVQAPVVCVFEKDEYDASEHNELAGVRFENADGAVALSVSAITVAGVDYADGAEAYTLTAKAFFFNDIADRSTDRTYRPVIKDLANASLSVGFGDEADRGVFNLTPTINAAAGEVEIVVNFGSTTPDDNAQKELEIEVKPPLGAPVTFTLEFPDLFD